MPTQKPKEAADDLAHLEILLEKILELAQKGALQLKAADALKIIELKQKLSLNKTSKEELLRPFLDMLERAGRQKGKQRRKAALKNKWLGLVFIGLALGAGRAQGDDTGYKNPATTAGQFTNPGNVVSSNDSRAIEGTVNDTMASWDFSFNIPADAQSINGILIEAEGRLLENPLQGGGSTGDLQIRLSWNGGSSWTSAKTEIYTEGGGEFYHSFGGAADTWGRSWTVTETNNTNFRVSLKYSREDIAQDQIEIDHVRAKIFFSPASGGLSPRRNRLFKKP